MAEDDEAERRDQPRTLEHEARTADPRRDTTKSG
jgi:hypothetical protein